MKDGLMCMNAWDCQSKRQYGIDGVYPALNAGQGIGGQAHGVCYTLQGNLVDRNVGMNGIGVSDEGVSYTLNEVDRHAVCYGIDANSTDSRFKLNEPEEPFPTLTNHMSKLGVDVPMVLIDKTPDVYGIDSHPMDIRIRIQNPDEPVQTLSRKMYKGTADVPMVLIDRTKSRGGTFVIDGNGARPSHMGPGFAESDTMYTLNTIDRNAVAYRSSHPRRDCVFQNTCHGWWNESEVCETIRTGDSMKANLIVEAEDGI